MKYLYIICFLLINISCGYICKKTMSPNKTGNGLNIVSPPNKKRRVDVVSDNLNDISDVAKLDINRLNKDLLGEILNFCDIYTINYFGMVNKYFKETIESVTNIYHINYLEIAFCMSPDEGKYFYQVVPNKIIKKTQKIILKNTCYADIIFPKKCDPNQLIYNITKGNSFKIIDMDLMYIYEIEDLLSYPLENLKSLKYSISSLDGIENGAAAKVLIDMKNP